MKTYRIRVGQCNMPLTVGAVGVVTWEIRGCKVPVEGCQNSRPAAGSTCFRVGGTQNQAHLNGHVYDYFVTFNFDANFSSE